MKMNEHTALLENDHEYLENDEVDHATDSNRLFLAGS